MASDDEGLPHERYRKEIVYSILDLRPTTSNANCSLCTILINKSSDRKTRPSRRISRSGANSDEGEKNKQKRKKEKRKKGKENDSRRHNVTQQRICSFSDFRFSDFCLRVSFVSFVSFVYSRSGPPALPISRVACFPLLLSFLRFIAYY